MNREETIKFYEECRALGEKEGREKWNAWANKMLEERKRLEESGEWEGEVKKEWEKKASVDFGGHSFKEGVDFTSFIFPSNSMFNNASFSSLVYFSGAEFYDRADFRGVTFDSVIFGHVTFHNHADFSYSRFKKSANFGWTKFLRQALFIEVVFYKDAGFPIVQFFWPCHFQRAEFRGSAFFRARFYEGADFRDAKFLEKANFRWSQFSVNYTKKDKEKKFRQPEQAVFFDNAFFEKHADFKNVVFNFEAKFYAINSKAGFALSEAEFSVAPDFTEASFLEATELDRIIIHDNVRHVIPSSIELRNKLNDEGEIEDNLTARYRALKRMAIQAHDHKKEQDFFAAELKSMRGTEHNPPFKSGWVWYLMGYAYQGICDFGRSPLRVIEWMYIQCFVFTQLYGLSAKNPLQCMSGDGNIVYSALSLSVGNTIFPFGNHSDKSNEYLACLYDAIPQYGKKGGRFVPDISDWYAVISAFQTLFAVLLILLLLLSVRAHFRVK